MVPEIDMIIIIPKLVINMQLFSILITIDD